MAPKSRASLQIPAFPVTLFAHTVAVAIMVLVLVWLLKFREGLAFRSADKNKIFNVHPLLMIIGVVLISGEAIMAYKTIPARRRVQKRIHLILQFMALAAGIVGVYAVFVFHAEIKTAHVYTLHSWFGLSTIALFGLQWILAFFSFVFPGAEFSRKAAFVPWHVLLGMIIFLMTILTAEMGLTEKFLFLKLKHNQESLIVKFTGLLIFLFAISVVLAAKSAQKH